MNILELLNEPVRARGRERARHNPLGQPFSKANADWQYSRIMNGDLGRVKT